MIFRKFLDKFCIVYLDNILIYNNNKLEHKVYIKLIFRKLRKANL